MQYFYSNQDFEAEDLEEYLASDDFEEQKVAFAISAIHYFCLQQNNILILENIHMMLDILHDVKNAYERKDEEFFENIRTLSDIFEEFRDEEENVFSAVWYQRDPISGELKTYIFIEGEILCIEDNV